MNYTGNSVIDGDTGSHSSSPYYKPSAYMDCFKCAREFHISELVYLDKGEGMLMGDEHYCEGCLADNQFYVECPGNHEADEQICKICNA